MTGAGEGGHERAGSALRRVPTLDGIRGLAVLAVLLFHSGFSWAKGGFLGVSVFFTLSGFLITSLLLDEHAAHGRPSLRHFWSRRARRLLPAALACLVGISLAAYYGALAADRSLTGDLVAAAAYVANWRALGTGHSYVDLFRAPSPVAHFWSLAIEEQFYLLFPPVAVWLLCRRRGAASGPLRLARAAVGIWVLGTGLAVSGLLDRDLVYLGTLTRAPELAAGVVTAVVLYDPGTRTWRRRLPPAVGALASMAAFGGLAVLVARTSSTTAWLYRGGFAAVSVLSAGLIVGAVADPGWVRLLRLRPLVWLGAVSYGVYLLHWPLFLALTPERTSVDGPALHALRWGITLVGAAASYRWFERPIRTGTMVRGVGRITVPAGAFASVAVVAVAISVSAPSAPATELADAQDAFAVAAASAQTGEGTSSLPGAGPVAGANGANPTPSPLLPEPPVAASQPVADSPPLPGGRPLNVAFFGDSTALQTGAGFSRWARAHRGSARFIGGVSRIGCGLETGGLQGRQDQPQKLAKACPDWRPVYARFLAQHRTDIAVLMFGFNDIGDRKVSDDDPWRSIGDPVLDARLVDDMHELQQLFDDRGIPTLWTSLPELRYENGLVPGDVYPQNQPGRREAWNRLLASAAASMPTMHIAPMGEWLATQADGAPGGPWRPDGLHLTASAAATVTDQWLFPELLAQFAPG